VDSARVFKPEDKYVLKGSNLNQRK